MIWLPLLAALLLAPSRPAGAQEESVGLGEAAGPIRELRGVKGKLLAFVFDVSGSMKGENLRRAREATIALIREATGPGDRVALYTFGAGYRTVFDTTLASEAQKRELIDQVPSRPGEGAGTNIRKPHHEALRLAERLEPKPAAIVLLTDSFNDQPRVDDPAYAEYVKYYLPGGRLDKYPDTPENRDYERLLGKMRRTSRFRVYGIGVRIDESGRPVERLPQAAPSVEPVATPAPSRFSSVAPAKSDSNLPWLLGVLAALALAGIAAAVVFLNRPMPVRIAGGPDGPKDFSLKGNAPVRLGGDGAKFAADAYTIPGVKEPVALLRGGRGQMTVAPSPQPAGSARVFHNGLPLEKPGPLRYGDEIRVVVPEPSGAGVPKEYRLKFADPTKTF